MQGAGLNRGTEAGQTTEARECARHMSVRACLVTQPCLTLRNPMDCSPPGSSLHGILQARILEWVAMLCSRGSSQPRDRTHLSYVSGIGRWEAHVVNMHNLTWMSLKVHLQVTFQALQVTLTL